MRVPRELIHSCLDGRRCDRVALERALVAEELAVLVFLWPPYAPFNRPSGIARVRRRARELQDRYFDGTAHGTVP
ncbi:hypothetical protein G4Z16_02285 [Streptomyces bathyalis]|uniref:Uncharacterized protein n=1 Tax=Streptomyces bathyalis TaxID=2710756 RepID=A0A7T1WS64_9ACTN|nr:hypothetical protein [Streptomyces bathyalis]QPP05410.1 hypothetical protein G4Z16_02285 [Streptomyces bathyalis]